MKQLVENQIKYFSQFDLENPKLNTINIECTNICDLHCVMCKRGSRDKGYITIELLEDILIEAKELGVSQIGLHTVGESILHPEIDKIVKICKKYNFYTYLDVNGNSLTQEKSLSLLEAGLDSIKFSIDASDDQSYAKIRRGGKFTTVFENIKTLRKLRDTKKFSIKIFALFIIMQENQHQREKFKSLMENVVDEIQYTVINQAANRISEIAYSGLQIEDFNVPNKLGLCANPFTRLVVTWQGDVSMCCIDFDLDMKIGSYKKGSLGKIWRSENANKIRKAMKEKDIKVLPVICRKCDNLKYDAAERSRKINEYFK